MKILATHDIAKNVRLNGEVGAKASEQEGLPKNVRHEDAPRHGISRNEAAGIRSNAEGGIPRRETQKRKRRVAIMVRACCRLSHRIGTQRQKYTWHEF